MKLITFVVPCYNSAEYLERCVETILPGGKEIEIILVNDGSTDQTPMIIDEYVNNYPNLIKAVHKENGGHGDAVMKGLEKAEGIYFKVVDSDDWLKISALKKIIDQIKILEKKDQQIDLIINNYVYENQFDNTSKVMKYTNVLPENKIFDWNACGKFRISQYLIMHAVIYRTEILKKSNLFLPKHTFYVDNLFVYQPFPFVDNIYYFNYDLYRYFIGREDQSVNEEVMIKQVDQQLKVTEIMLEAYDLNEVKQKSEKLAKYMLNHLSMLVSITSILLFLDGSKEKIKIHKRLWQKIKNNYPKIYFKIKYKSFLFPVSFKTSVGRKIAIIIYRITKKIYHFN
ncbi:glycosyltransferase family 2 protein [Halanaerobium praevalens]|uniref:Glycosyl transferase family 2 n=1 Tax=Halanaerobium praevalens (strain ATCC 33744 / DSM 2228 / GSL) TaxID=572479 RepID=E3DM06_HALPG|nr:glycosyltransferase family 2 protein [Halanaerobium praevalens]ADO76265.1 glycosyl transferase family 2 [Halanaerobium praevalens DSM 2228]